MPGVAVLVDTGPLVALFDPSEHAHAQCRDELALLEGRRLVTTLAVVVEASYLLAFSADDSLVLVSRQASTGPGQLEVVNWRSRQVIWTYQLSQFESAGSYLAAQSGGDFAIALQGSLLDVVVVHPDGTTTNILDPHNTMW